MDTITTAVRLVEEEIKGLRSQVDKCREHIRLCGSGCDPGEKASTLAEAHKELDICRRSLGHITGMLDSLQEKRRELQTFYAETAAILEQSLKESSPSGEDDFSPSSISPLA